MKKYLKNKIINKLNKFKSIIFKKKIDLKFNSRIMILYKVSFWKHIGWINFFRIILILFCIILYYLYTIYQQEILFSEMLDQWLFIFNEDLTKNNIKVSLSDFENIQDNTEFFYENNIRNFSNQEIDLEFIQNSSEFFYENNIKNFSNQEFDWEIIQNNSEFFYKNNIKNFSNQEFDWEFIQNDREFFYEKKIKTFSEQESDYWKNQSNFCDNDTFYKNKYISLDDLPIDFSLIKIYFKKHKNLDQDSLFFNRICYDNENLYMINNLKGIDGKLPLNNINDRFFKLNMGAINTLLSNYSTNLNSNDYENLKIKSIYFVNKYLLNFNTTNFNKNFVSFLTDCIYKKQLLINKMDNKEELYNAPGVYNNWVNVKKKKTIEDFMFIDAKMDSFICGEKIPQESIFCDYFEKNKKTFYNYEINLLLNRLFMTPKRLNASYTLLYFFEKNIDSLNKVEKCFIITELKNILKKNNIKTPKFIQKNIPTITLEQLFGNFLHREIFFLLTKGQENNINLNLKKVSKFVFKKEINACSLIELIYDFNEFEKVFKEKNINISFERNKVFYNCLALDLEFKIKYLQKKLKLKNETFLSENYSDLLVRELLNNKYDHHNISSNFFVCRVLKKAISNKKFENKK